MKRKKELLKMLLNSKDHMAKQIEEKENEYADLENLTKRQKEEFNNLLLNYSEASEKLEEIKKELENRTKEIDEYDHFAGVIIGSFNPSSSYIIFNKSSFLKFLP